MSSTSGLQFVEPTADPNLNVFLYGLPKSGKTIGAASAPGPTLYLNADSPNAVRKAHQFFPGDIREVRVEGVETLLAALEVA